MDEDGQEQELVSSQTSGTPRTPSTSAPQRQQSSSVTSEDFRRALEDIQRDFADHRRMLQDQLEGERKVSL